jgi:acetyl esterase
MADPLAALSEPIAQDTLAMLALIEATPMGVPEITAESVLELRRQAQAQAPPPYASARDITPEGLRLRVFEPSRVRGVYLHIHGGGWIAGENTHLDPQLAALSEALDMVVVSAGYRLAPEHPFPAAQEDCEAAAHWLVRKVEAEFGTDCLMIGGESAGAHLSLTTALRLRDRYGYSELLALDLRYGMYDLRLTPGARHAQGGVLGASQLRAITRLVTTREHLEDPDVSPLLASLHDLPPAVFTVGTSDSLLEDTLFLWTRWRAAGNQAELLLAPGGWHGFDFSHPRLGPEAREPAIAFFRDQLAKRLGQLGSERAAGSS